MLGIFAVGAWFFLGRGGPATATLPEAPPEPVAQLAPPPAGATSASPVASATAVTVDPSPPAAPEQPAPSAPGTTPRGTAAVPRSAVPVQPQPAPVRSTGGQTAAAPRQAAPPPPLGDGFLDQLPEDAPDGRAAADALAQQYRSGGGSGSAFGSTNRFRRRPRIAPHGPAEQPAVRALAWILSAENAHLRRTGRYGTLDELVESGDLPLRGERSDDGFTRQRYRFTVSASGETFRAEARPLAPAGRAFYVDDAGFVLLDE